MSLPRVSANRPVAVGMCVLAVLMVGLVSLRRLPIDLLPDISYPQIVVYTEDPGGAPTEVERAVTEQIERAVASVPGVLRLESLTREGVSLVTVRFAWGTDMDFAALNVRERLDNVVLPDLAGIPTVLRTDPRSEPVMSISVAGPGDPRALKELAEQVFKRRLEQLDGVAQAAITGGFEREIQVEVDLARLESYGLTIDDVARALDAANASGQGGTILQGRYRYPLRTLGEFRSPEEIGAVVLQVRGQAPTAGTGATGTASGTPQTTVLLRDVATITDGVRERESIARFSGLREGGDGEVRSGGEAVGLLVFKTAGANTVRVSEQVEATLEQLRVEYPEVQLEVAVDQAGFISEAISNVLQALIFGGILAFLVLFLFLRQARYPVAIAVSIPVSVVGSFALLDAVGVTLNIMTLGGLALGVGMLVDNSIVVLENIFRLREEGLSAGEAAVRGAEEVQGAITASTLTTIAVFGPIVYVEGVAGQLFSALSFAVAFSLLASLLVALTVLPMMAARWERGETPGHLRALVDPLLRAAGDSVRRATRGPLDAFDRGFARFATAYHGVLERSLSRRGRIVAISLSLFAVTLLVALMLPRGVLPDVEQHAFRARLELERGTPIDRTREVTEMLEAALLADPDVDQVFSQVGRAGASASLNARDAGLHTATLEVRLTPGASTRQVVARLRELLASTSGAQAWGIPVDAVEVETGGGTALGRLLGGNEADLAVRVRSEDLEAALEYSTALGQRLGSLPRLTNVRVGTELGQPEMRVAIDRERAASFGVEPRQVADVIERAMRGAEATQFADFDRRIPVVVRLPDEERRSLGTLEALRVGDVPIRQLVSLEPGFGPAEVHRIEQGRVVPVFADVTSGGLAGALAQVEEAIAEFPPPAGMRVEIGGENEEMRESFRALAFAFGLALLLVYMILAAQFESLVHPFTVLLSVPLASIGAVGALALTGSGLNTMSLIGIVILVGIAVNDAIIKVDLINRLRAEGHSLRDAILRAGEARLRPILMTTITTVLGLLPMAMGIGSGADLRAPLAIALIGGLSVATMMTLIVIPVAYDLIESARARIAGNPVAAPPPAPAVRASVEVTASTGD